MSLNIYFWSNSFENFNKSSSKASLILFPVAKFEEDSGTCEGINRSSGGTGEDVDDGNSVKNGFNKCERLDASDCSEVEIGKNNGIDVVGVKCDNCNGTILDDWVTGIGLELDKGVEVYSEDVVVVDIELDDGNSVANVDGGMTEEWMVELTKLRVVDSVNEFEAGVDSNDRVTSFEAGVRIKFGEGFDAKIEADVEIEVGKGNGEDNAEVYSLFGNKSIESGFIPNNPQEDIERTPAFPTYTNQ